MAVRADDHRSRLPGRRRRRAGAESGELPETLEGHPLQGYDLQSHEEDYAKSLLVPERNIHYRCAPARDPMACRHGIELGSEWPCRKVLSECSPQQVIFLRQIWSRLWTGVYRKRMQPQSVLSPGLPRAQLFRVQTYCTLANPALDLMLAVGWRCRVHEGHPTAGGHHDEEPPCGVYFLHLMRLIVDRPADQRFSMEPDAAWQWPFRQPLPIEAEGGGKGAGRVQQTQPS